MYLNAPISHLKEGIKENLQNLYFISWEQMLQEANPHLKLKGKQ